MRIAVSGARNWKHYRTVVQRIRRLPRDTIITEGEAEGLDSMAARAARWFGMSVDPHPARWIRNGEFHRAAGYERNAAMLDTNPDLVIAFHTNLWRESKGTQMMVRLARDRHIPVEIIYRPWPKWGVNVQRVALWTPTRPAHPLAIFNIFGVPITELTFEEMEPILEHCSNMTSSSLPWLGTLQIGETVVLRGNDGVSWKAALVPLEKGVPLWSSGQHRVRTYGPWADNAQRLYGFYHGYPKIHHEIGVIPSRRRNEERAKPKPKRILNFRLPPKIVK